MPIKRKIFGGMMNHMNIAFEVLNSLEKAGSYAGRLSSDDLNRVFKLFKEKKISLRPNNPATGMLLGNICFGGIFGGAIGLILGRSYASSVCGAAIGACLSYLFTTFSVSVAPTGDRDSRGVPLWEIELTTCRSS